MNLKRSPLFTTKRTVALINSGKIAVDLKFDLSAETAASHGVPQKSPDTAE
jgi:hypothetical protein